MFYFNTKGSSSGSEVHMFDVSANSDNDDAANDGSEWSTDDEEGAT